MTALMSSPGLEVVGGLRFEDFYRDYRRKIATTLAASVGDYDLGFEATDEAMSRAYQRWGDVSACRNPQGWVFRTGRNWAVSALRRRAKWRAKAPLLVSNLACQDARPDEDLLRAVSRLADDHREIIEMRFYSDLSVNQVVSELGIPAGTVKSRLSRALVALERELAPGG